MAEVRLAGEGEPMDDADRFRLHFGPYRTPRFHVGRVVRCRVRGEVTICGLSAAPIPWPLCRTGSRTSPVVHGGLFKAVKRESAVAVGHRWGVSRNTSWTWRKALGVGPTTETEQQNGEMVAAWPRGRSYAGLAKMPLMPASRTEDRLSWIPNRQRTCNCRIWKPSL